MYEFGEHACVFAGVVEFVVELVYECPLFGDRAGSRHYGRHHIATEIRISWLGFGLHKI